MYIPQVQGEIQEIVKTGLWVGDCFIYTSSVNRLNYFVGGEIVTIAHLDRYDMQGNRGLDELQNKWSSIAKAMKVDGLCSSGGYWRHLISLMSMFFQRVW